jgi:hypothetical protein
LILYNLYQTKIDARRAIQQQTARSPEAMVLMLIILLVVGVALGGVIVLPFSGDEDAVATALGHIFSRIPRFAS